MPPKLPRQTLVLVPLFLLVFMSLPAAPNHFLNLIPISRAANVFTVNSTGDGADSNLADGVCNDGAGACTLRAAIQEANNDPGDDTITFSLSLGSTISLNTALPDIAGDLTITGPGSNLLTVTRSTAGGTPNFRIFAINSGPTISLSGLRMTNGITVSSQDGGGIFNGATLTLNDVAIDGNQTSGTAGSGGWGGAISNGGTLTLNNCSVNNNRTAGEASGGFGGAIVNTGTLIVNSSTINNNLTGNGTLGNGGSGGAIFSHGTVTLNNSTISGNQTGTGGSHGSGGIGGGIASTNAVSLTNSHVDNNTAAGQGGGIYNSGSVTLIDSTVSGNQTTDSIFAASGGGIHNHFNATLTLTDSTISGNHTGNSTSGGAGGYGGGVHNLGTMTATGSTFIGNQTGLGIMVGGYGAGVFNGGNVSLTNSTVSGNQTGNAGNPEGGGIQNVGTLTLTNSTVSNNSALGPFGHGGGLNNVSGTITLQNTIVAGNFRINRTTPDDIGGSVVLSSSFNLIGTGGSGGLSDGVSNNQVGVANPGLGPLGNNGGATVTHALLFASPAIDAGSSALTTDQRGQPRPIDDQSIVNASGSNASDIGAFEAHNFQVNSIADLDDGACTSISTGNGCTLREAINSANSEAGAEAITFASALTVGGPVTITLATALPNLLSDVMLTGSGANLLTVQRNIVVGTPDFRIFTINVGKTVTITDLTISNGKVSGTDNNGGGVLNQGTLTLTNCNLFGNSSGQHGGGISNEGVSLTLNNCNIGGTGAGQPNTCSASGGGIFAGGTLLVSGGSIAGNSGSGIAITGLATLNGVTIRNNTIGNSGGGILVLGTQSTANIVNCMIADNTAQSLGGGIHAAGGTANVLNSTVSGNRSGSGGGGVVSFNGSVILTNVTVTNNRSGEVNFGGGIDVLGGMTLHNTIVAGNFRGASPSTLSDDINGLLNLTSSFNLIGDGTRMTGISDGSNGNQVGTSIAPLNARLDPLANNGGLTLTHALLPGSPALDAGNNALIASPPFSEPPFTDQRGAGFARIVDGSDPNTTDTVDIGAFEAQVAVPDIAYQTINEDGSLTLPFNVGGGASITSVTATSSNTILVPNSPANISVTGTGSSRTLLINPVANQFGTSTITVSVVSASGQSMADTFLLTVTSINDSPNDVALSNSVVADNSAANTTVGTFSTTDSDVGDTFTYSLVFGTGSVDNASFNISSNQLRTNSVFDFESKSSYSVRVRSTDSAGGFFEKQFAITVSDGLDRPGAISFSAANYSVGESDGSANVTLIRTGGADNNILAKVTLADVTTSPTDYRFSPGALDPTFTHTGTGLDNHVLALVQQQDGKTIIGGFFTSYNGTARQYVARLNSDGSLDNTFAQTGTGLNDFVWALAVQPDGKVLVGGNFTAYDGATRSRIARLNSDGTLDSTFAQTGTGFNDIVRGIAVRKDGKIVVVGHFTSYNGTTRSRVARLNSNGTLDVTFPLSGIGTDGTVGTVAMQSDEKLIIGGLFSEYGGVFRKNIARLNANGSLDMTFSQSPALSMTVIALALQPDGKVIIGGGGGFTPFNVGRLNSDGSLDSSFGQTGTGFDSVVTTLALHPDGKVVVGGFFDSYNDTPRRGVARLNPDGTLDSGFTQTGTGFETFSNPYALAIQPDGRVLVGGTFAAYNGTTRFFIARLEGDFFVSWAAGDSSSRIINLPIIDDSLDEPNETLDFTVTPLTGGATTGTNPTATLTIVDNDPGLTSLSSVSGIGVFDETSTLTATLTSSGSPLNGQSVSFTLNGIAAGSATTNTSGVATLLGVSLAGINAGAYPTAVGVSFTGDGANFLSSSNTGPLAVGKALTATSVTSSVNPSDLGQSVTFIVTVTSSAGIPTGTVQFKSDGSTIGSPVVLNANGSATFITSSLTAGSHTISADYGGDTNFSISTGTLPSSQVVTPSVSINDVSISEGDSGTRTADFTVTLAGASSVQVKVDFVTANSTGIAGSDYQTASGTVTFNPGQTTQPISVTINGDIDFEPNETFFVNLSNAVNATIADNQGLGTILNDDAQGGFISFSQSDYTVGESGGVIAITANRSSDLSGSATVDYATSDDSGAATVVPCSAVSGIASSRCDFTSALGRLRFAAGESSKTFLVLISQDNYVEGPESLTLTLSNPTGGAVLIAPSTTTLTITDDATEPATNPIDSADAFVRQHYHDFLNREPDAAGLAFWSDQITSCGTDTACTELRRINVSAAFFLSIEFQETGYLVYRMYKSAYDDLSGTPVPVVLHEFLPDTQEIGKGVLIGQTGWEQALENSKHAFAANFVTRSRFSMAHPTTLTPEQFVNALFTNAGVTPSIGERMGVIEEFGGASNTTELPARGRALRRVAENSTLAQQETNKAFVLMQYFGYLRRNPNDGLEPGSNFDGYNFWLGKLNQFNGNFINAEMVKAFIHSGEYRQRFGP